MRIFFAFFFLVSISISSVASVNMSSIQSCQTIKQTVKAFDDAMIDFSRDLGTDEKIKYYHVFSYIRTQSAVLMAVLMDGNLPESSRRAQLAMDKFVQTMQQVQVQFPEFWSRALGQDSSTNIGSLILGTIFHIHYLRN